MYSDRTQRMLGKKIKKNTRNSGYAQAAHIVRAVPPSSRLGQTVGDPMEHGSIRRNLGRYWDLTYPLHLNGNTMRESNAR